MDKLLKKIRTSREKSEKSSMRTEMKLLRKELRQRESQVVNDLMKNRYVQQWESNSYSDVVLATNIGAGDRLLRVRVLLNQFNGQDLLFDTVIIDEAAQALEAR